MSDDQRGEVAARRLVGLTPVDGRPDATDPRARHRDVLTPVTDERRVAVGTPLTPPRAEAHLVVPDRGEPRRRRGRRPRRAPRGLMELSAVAAAYTEQAAVRSEQRQTLRRSAQAVEEVSTRLRRQSEEPMLDGLQGDPARVAYLTLALHLRDTADAITSSLDGLDLAERAMQEAHEEFRRIETIDLAPAHRSLLALGEPIVVSGVGMLTPAAAQQHWLGEVGQEQKVAARQAMQRFESDMARAASLMRPVEPPPFAQERRAVVDPPLEVHDPGTVDPQPAPEVAAVVEEPPAGGGAAGGAGAAAAGAGAARLASARRAGGGGGGGGYRSAGAAASGAPRDTWVSTRAQHDTGPDGTMDPAAASPGTSASSGPTTTAAAAAAGGGAAVPHPPATGAQSAGEEESGTAVVRTAHEDEAAAAVVAATSSSGSRSTIEQAPAESEDW